MKSIFNWKQRLYMWWHGGDCLGMTWEQLAKLKELGE